ncbi:hypothetical protein K8O92_22525 [Nocardia asteroides]|nr:hypothetical protein K8O92_22525 [Nocardia asteroides]
MNERYSSWAARNTPEELPLAARYQSADPIVWHGSMVYPMYTEQVGPAPTTVTLTMISAAPPAGLRGLGMGLSVIDGYLDLHGRSLAGVDAWSDALAAGVSFDVTPTAPATLVTLTPVWVDEFGTQKSWTGNYGIVVEHRPNGRIVLWCSIGEGPPNFANLVVEVSTAPTAVAPEPPAPPATSPTSMSSPAPPPASSAGPPTAPTMPVPRIDAGPAPTEPAASVEQPAAHPPAAGNGVNGQAMQSGPPRRPGSLFVNLQSSRATPETSQASLGSPTPDNPNPLPRPLVGQPAADVTHTGPDSLAADAASGTDGESASTGSRLPHEQTGQSAQRSAPERRAVNGRSAPDPYGAFGPPVAHTHPPEDPARRGSGLLIGNTPPAPEFLSPATTRPAANGPRTDPDPLVTNPWTAPDAFNAFDSTGTHTESPAETSSSDSDSPLAQPHPAPHSPGSAAANNSPTDCEPLVTNPWTAPEASRAFDPTGTPTRSPAEASLPDSGPPPAQPRSAPEVSNSPAAPQAPHSPPPEHPADDPSALVTQTLPMPSTPVAASSIQVHTTASALDKPVRPAERSSTVGASPRASEPGQSGDPGYRGALYDLGVAMYRRGEEEQACELWAQASEAGHAGAAYELGMVRLRRGDPVGAESWWRTAADRREPRAIAELADLLDQLGKHAEAKSWRAYAAEQHEADAVDQPTSR